MTDLKWLWKCDADCELCEFKRNGRCVPLDRERRDAHGTAYRESDLVPNPDPRPESIATDRITLRKLLERLGELCPDSLQR